MAIWSMKHIDNCETGRPEAFQRKVSTMPDESTVTESDKTEDLFPLFESDRGLIEALVGLVRKLIHRADAIPEQIHDLAILLFGLERLPLATPGLGFEEVSLSYRSENEMRYQSITLDEASFSLSSGGSVYTPGAGSDTFSEDLLLAEVGGYRRDGTISPRGWIVGFEGLIDSGELTIELSSGECDVDWGLEADESAWERAAKKYNEDGRSEDDY
jgi:hypothetical protein